MADEFTPKPGALSSPRPDREHGALKIELPLFSLDRLLLEPEERRGAVRIDEGQLFYREPQALELLRIGKRVFPDVVCGPDRLSGPGEQGRNVHPEIVFEELDGVAIQGEKVKEAVGMGYDDGAPESAGFSVEGPFFRVGKVGEHVRADEAITTRNLCEAFNTPKEKLGWRAPVLRDGEQILSGIYADDFFGPEPGGCREHDPLTTAEVHNSLSVNAWKKVFHNGKAFAMVEIANGGSVGAGGFLPMLDGLNIFAVSKHGDPLDDGISKCVMRPV